MNTQHIIPLINATGVFELRSPLNNLISKKEAYTCIGVRKISDYLANNEDVLEIYKSLQIEESYENDSLNDIHLLSLQSAVGHNLQVPSTYVLKYPIVNGVLYRAIMLGVSLPSIPTNTELNELVLDITNSVIDHLGVTPDIKMVETSRPVFVSDEKHIETKSARDIIKGNQSTNRSKYHNLLISYQSALNKIAELEAYIISQQ